MREDESLSTLFRFKCPKCGKVAEITGDCPCPKCHALSMLPADGVIQIHRNSKGYRSLERTRLFINEIPLGYMRDMESIRIPVLYGHYSIRMTYLGDAFRTSTISFEFAAPEEMPPLYD